MEGVRLNWGGRIYWEDRMKSMGQRRVRVAFNPSGKSLVDEIKSKAAELIDLIDSVPVPEGGEVGGVHRLKALGMTAAEESAMWGVKAAT